MAEVSIEFNEKSFFYFLLPPIIFAAGYTLKRRNFIRNIMYILILGLIGTILSMIALSVVIIILNEWAFEEQDENKLLQSECLLLAAVLCATDTVAALSIVRESQFPTLNSILFGEGVVNDAVAILIFKAVDEMIRDQGGSSGEVKITMSTVGLTAWKFLYLSILSILTGLLFGLVSAFISKTFKSFKEHPVKEIFLMVLIAYLSYVISELFELSAIMSLFVCGVTMSHYTYHNISSDARIGSVQSINTLGHATEAFLFIYLGLSIFSIDQESFNLPFIIYIMIGGGIARAFSVAIPIGIYWLIKCR